MISNAIDFMPIATWEVGGQTYVVQVAAVQDLPTSILVGCEGPGLHPCFAMQPTDRSLTELIAFWNAGSTRERTDAAEVILGIRETNA